MHADNLTFELQLAMYAAVWCDTHSLQFMEYVCLSTVEVVRANSARRLKKIGLPREDMIHDYNIYRTHAHTLSLSHRLYENVSGSSS